MFTKSRGDFFGLLGGGELERLISFMLSLTQTEKRGQLCPVSKHTHYLSLKYLESKGRILVPSMKAV